MQKKSINHEIVMLCDNLCFCRSQFDEDMFLLNKFSPFYSDEIRYLIILRRAPPINEACVSMET